MGLKLNDLKFYHETRRKYKELESRGYNVHKGLTCQEIITFYNRIIGK